MKQSYQMDGVSNMFPALGGHLFRASVIFNDKIDVNLLKKSLLSLVGNFPIIFTHLEKTINGYIHINATNFDIINIGEGWMSPLELDNPTKPALRMYVDDKLLSVDFFHGNADGHMANKFMTALVDRYCAYRYDIDYIELPIPTEDDLVDPYYMYYKKAKIVSVGEKSSYVLTQKLEPYNYNRLSNFTLDVAEVKKLTKRYRCSVNDFIVCLYYNAIINATKAKTSNKPVTISVGIDLRSFFNSNTHRNFDYYVNVRFDDKCKYSFDNALKSMQNQVKKAIEPSMVNAGVSSVHKLAYNPIVKYAPRQIKDPIFRLSYHLVSDYGITSTLSNIGISRISEDSKKHINRMEIYLNIFKAKVNAAFVSCNDKLSLGITYNSKDRSIDRELGKLFSEFGLDYELNEREFY